MINVTRHAYTRYAERIKLVEKEDLETSLIVNKDQYHLDLDKMFQNSKLIYTGQFNDKHSEANFRIVDNIILITDIADTKIITLYRVDFGFDRDVDLTILTSLLEKLNFAEEEYIGAIEEVNEEKVRVVTNRDNLKLEIEQIEEQLKYMKESLEIMNSYVDKFDYKERVAKTEMNSIAKKIVYSNIYRKEMMECM